MMMPMVLRLISVAMMMAILISACARVPSGDRTLQRLRLQTEERLLQDARVAFFQGKYQEAGLLLDRFLTNHSSSRLVDEARWWLARAQQQQGDLHAALAGYRQLAHGRHKNPFRDEARLRVAELESLLGVHLEAQDFVGGLIGLATILQPNGMESAMDVYRRTSGTAIMVDVPCQPPGGEGEVGSLPQDSVGVWNRLVQEGLPSLVRLGKEQGFGVWVAVPLRCLGSYYGLTLEQARRWKDHIYNIRSGGVEPSGTFSLFSAEYRDVVFSLLSQLSALRVEGLLFRATASPGPYEGLTTLAMRGFEQQFGEQLVPEVIFSSAPQGHSDTSPDAFSQRASLTVDYPPQFWKWSGWKAREGIRYMNELAVHLRNQWPALKIGLELHAESVENPVSALINVSEDWIEMSQGEFDVLAVHAPQSALPTNMRATAALPGLDSSAPLISGMVEYLGKADRIWMILPGEESMTKKGRERNPGNLPQGVGFLYDFTVIP